jgi:hypothetical protein
MPDRPTAYLAHAMPGRTRLRLPSFRDDIAGLSALGLTIAQRDGVAAVETSGVTGSVLVRHDGPLDALLRATEDLFILSEDAPPSLDWSTVPVSPAVLPAAGAVAAAGLAVVQLMRGDPLPPALTLGIHALSLVRKALDLAAADEAPRAVSHPAPPTAR